MKMMTTRVRARSGSEALARCVYSLQSPARTRFSRKRGVWQSKPAKKAKKEDADDDDDDDFDGVRIEMNQAVTLTFSLKYLVNFSKSSSLSKKVQLMMSNDVPLLVRFFLVYLFR